ncbi:MAG: hypothetical protein U0169_21595 [Polyangiaceae bacterium]
MPPEGGPGGTTIGPDGAVTLDAGADAERPADCDPGVPPIKLTRVVEGVDSALFVTSPKGDTSRLFVVLQDGTIRISKDGTLLPKPFLDLTPSSRREANKDSSASFHPDYATNGRFFVSYTTSGAGSPAAR